MDYFTQHALFSFWFLFLCAQRLTHTQATHITPFIFSIFRCLLSCPELCEFLPATSVVPIEQCLIYVPKQANNNGKKKKVLKDSFENLRLTVTAQGTEVCACSCSR